MISDSASSGRRLGGWDAVAALLAADGSATHPHVAALLSPRAAQRDLSDAMHTICSVHGNASERFHEAMAHPAGAAHRDWLGSVADGFADERSYLASIVSAAGPLPSTPGQAQTEQAFAAARHAFQMLALSDRDGCVLGAAVALVLDWQTIRALLDQAATRFGVEPAEETLPETPDVAARISADIASPAAERAMMFGIHQVLSQQRALWEVLAARASARDAG